MKKKLFVFFTVALMSFSPLALLVTAAQEPLLANAENDTNTQDVDVELSYETQDPGSKEFFLTAKIESAIGSDRAIVQWVLPGAVILGEGEFDNTTVSLKEGQETTVRVRVKPVYQAVDVDIKVNVTAVKADVSYLGSDSMKISFNKDMEITPLSKEYKQAKLVRQATKVILVMLVGTGLFAGVFFIFTRLRSSYGKN